MGIALFCPSNTSNPRISLASSPLPRFSWPFVDAQFLTKGPLPVDIFPLRHSLFLVRYLPAYLLPACLFGGLWRVLFSFLIGGMGGLGSMSAIFSSFSLNLGS